MNTSTASWSRHSWFRDVSMVFAIVTALCSITSAHAHAVGTSYLHIDPAGSDSEVAVRVELSIRDIEFAVGLDANGDGRITWGEVNSSTPALVTYIGRKFGLSRGGHQCALGDSDIALDQHTDELYAVLSTTAACGSNGALAVQSDLFFEIDDSHRTLLAVANDEQSGGDGAVSVLTSTTRHWSTAEPAGAWQDFARFVGQGAWHIWIGFDHLAFLMLLLLPLARATTLDEQPHIWPRVTSILKVVTAFTAAHSITLICATLGLLHFSARWVEALIAASIVVAALANIANVATRYGAAMAFGFGLIHGLGFASALADITTSTTRVIPLIGFNFGVELGQLAVVAAVFPLLFLWRGSPPIKDRAILAGSIAMGAAGISWLVQRTLLS